MIFSENRCTLFRIMLSSEVCLMAKNKPSTVGPMSVQPDNRQCTARNQRAMPTIGEDKTPPLPKAQQTRMTAVRAAKARITRRNSLRKQREAQKG